MYKGVITINKIDTFKKVQEIDKKGIDKNDPVVTFLKEYSEEYKKAVEMFKSMYPDGDENNNIFSSDLVTFNEECTKLINYIKQCVENPTEIYVLYIFRKGNLIDYGRCEQSTNNTGDTIKMVSNEDLRELYRLLQQEFSSSFNAGFKHTFGEFWSLIPIIGENVMINISSDNKFDLDWFYEEAHKKQESYSSRNSIK